MCTRHNRPAKFFDSSRELFKTRNSQRNFQVFKILDTLIINDKNVLLVPALRKEVKGHLLQAKSLKTDCTKKNQKHCMHLLSFSIQRYVLFVVRLRIVMAMKNSCWLGKLLKDHDSLINLHESHTKQF